MEATFSSLVNQEFKPQFDFDLGYSSACSGSLSPTSSIDSSCFSPSVCQFRAVLDPPKESEWTSQAWEKLPIAAFSTQIKRRTRSKNPGKKRQSASEREKLRMRDLTKALHHLRSFLPPSVVPAGQTLTKIETLRLTIHYISHLSFQLGLDESSSHAGDVQNNYSTLPLQQGGVLDTWSQNEIQQNLQYSSQSCQPSTVFTSSAQTMETSPFATVYYKGTQLPLIYNQTSETYTH